MCFVTFTWKKTDSHIKIEKYLKESKARWAEIDIIENCDFNCIWCYANSPEKLDKSMDFETYKQIIDKLVDNDFIQITLSGGEPLQHKKIKNFIEYASKNNLIVHLNSNGYYLTKELAKNFKQAGLSQIQMNIESKDHFHICLCHQG